MRIRRRSGHCTDVSLAGTSLPAIPAKQGLSIILTMPTLPFALSLSKGRPFMVRPAHHERIWLDSLIIERPCPAKGDPCKIPSASELAPDWIRGRGLGRG